jgi:hypothetical protein
MTMQRSIFLIVGTAASLALAAGVRAQVPTYSLEATEVNGEPLPKGPTGKVSITPGDVFTAKIFVRDWSPNGEKLRSYQVTLDSAGFDSGDSGRIEPVGYRAARSNPQNAFIDGSDPTYVHQGFHTLPSVDSTASNYRWLTVLFNDEESPVSAQDGKKYSCGAVRMVAADDAAGTFTIGFVTDPNFTLLATPDNELIGPVEFENLVVHVEPPTHWLRIQTSEPVSGAIDARMLRSGRESCRWNSVQVNSSGDASSLTRDDFEVQDKTRNPPKITRIEFAKNSAGAAILHLSDGIAKGQWTTIVHRPSGTYTRIGCLPGDVNNDTVVDGRDVLLLIDAFNGRTRLNERQSDINGDGATSAQDLVELVDALAHQSLGPTQLAPVDH